MRNRSGVDLDRKMRKNLEEQKEKIIIMYYVRKKMYFK